MLVSLYSTIKMMHGPINVRLQNKTVSMKVQKQYPD